MLVSSGTQWTIVGDSEADVISFGIHEHDVIVGRGLIQAGELKIAALNVPEPGGLLPVFVLFLFAAPIFRRTTLETPRRSTAMP